MSEFDRRHANHSDAGTAPAAAPAAATIRAPQPTYELAMDARPNAVVVYCSDPRFQAAFEQFIAKELHLARGAFVPIVIAGGGGALARPHELPKEFKFMKDRLELAREYFPLIKRVVLITHEDCRYYESIKGKILGLIGAHFANAISPREDLPAVAGVFRHLLADLGLSVELYYAKFADEGHTRVTFEKLSA